MYGFLETLDPPGVEAITGQLFAELLRHGFTSTAEFHYLRNDPAGRAYDDPVEMGHRILSAAERSVWPCWVPTRLRPRFVWGWRSTRCARHPPRT
jgi:cytosine/adenosine deaminase-related metal-dependent hydrolase